MKNKIILPIALLLLLSSCGEEPGNKNVINIYATNGTLPTLYAGLNMVKDTNPSYIYFERTGTLNMDKFPDHVIGKKTGQDYKNLEYLEDIVKEEYKKDKDTIFHLFCDDLRIQYEIEFFVRNNISNYDVTLLSDGTGTYTYSFKDEYYKGENGEINFKNEEAFYNKVFEKAKEGEDVSSILNPNKVGNPMKLAQCALAASKKENIKYYLQYPETIKGSSSSSYVNNEYEKANLIKKMPYDMYNALNAEQRKDFLELVNFDKEYFDDIFNKNPKKDMIITGTSVSGSGNFEGYINRIIETYGDEYEYFYKPHPAHMPSPDSIINSNFLEQKGITTLPGRLPMEVLMWVYSDTKIGGYNSSLYMSSKPENVLFFLGIENSSELVAPLDTLANKNMFPNAQYIKL